MIRLFRARRVRRGQALVEFALALPIILLFLLGILDFGRAIYAHHTVANAARTAARVAIVDQTFTRVEAAALQEAVALDPDLTTVFMTYPYAASGCPDLDCIVRVRVTHDWSPVTPVIGSIVGPITISSASELPIESTSP